VPAEWLIVFNVVSGGVSIEPWNPEDREVCLYTFPAFAADSERG
jgi:hypothetical protein